MSIERQMPSPNRETPPASSREKLAQRRAAMPIIDVARVPWRVLRERWPRRAVWLFLWLRVVRPVTVTLFWLVIVRYAWTHFFGLPDDLPLWQQVTLYGIAVLLITLLMLALAPLRRREVRAEPAAEAAESTLPAISEFANVATEDLAQWQQVQRLVVHHNAQGELRRAEDLDGPAFEQDAPATHGPTAAPAPAAAAHAPPR